MKWWADMQVSTKKKGQPFEQLRKGGPNGLVTLLLGLKLWRMNIRTGEMAKWDGMTREVEAMLKSLHDTGTKRKEPPITQ